MSIELGKIAGIRTTSRAINYECTEHAHNRSARNNVRCVEISGQIVKVFVVHY